MAVSSDVTYSNNETQTTDASWHTVFAIPFNDNSSAHIQIRSLARRPSNTNTKTWYVAVNARRSGSSIIGTLTNIHTPIGDPGALSWDIQAVEDSGQLLIQCKGQSSATINWVMSAQVLYLED